MLIVTWAAIFVAYCVLTDSGQSFVLGFLYTYGYEDQHLGMDFKLWKRQTRSLSGAAGFLAALLTMLVAFVMPIVFSVWLWYVAGPRDPKKKG